MQPRETMRTFIAIDLPAELKKTLSDFSAEIKKSKLVDANFVKPEQMHLTLKFLGEVPGERISQIKQILQKILLKHN